MVRPYIHQSPSFPGISRDGLKTLSRIFSGNFLWFFSPSQDRRSCICFCEMKFRRHRFRNQLRLYIFWNISQNRMIYIHNLAKAMTQGSMRLYTITRLWWGHSWFLINRLRSPFLIIQHMSIRKGIQKKFFGLCPKQQTPPTHPTDLGLKGKFTVFLLSKTWTNNMLLKNGKICHKTLN